LCGLACLGHGKLHTRALIEKIDAGIYRGACRQNVCGKRAQLIEQCDQARMQNAAGDRVNDALSLTFMEARGNTARKPL